MKVMTNGQNSAWDRATWALPTLLVAGFLVRLLFIRSSGFSTDVSTFEAWTMSMLANGAAHFYAKTSFADYPPGYFYILWLVGIIWQPIRAHDPGFVWLSELVKLPAILADIGVAALLYAIARRFASPAIALGTAALYLFNPATIFISADWGQVDSIAGGLALLGAYFLLKSDDVAPERISWQIPAAWIALAYSLLIKPQAAVVIPVFIAFAFLNRERMRARLIGTAVGILCAFAFTIVLVEPFYFANPVAALIWLIGQFAHGSSVYPFNSVNAFNLWVIHAPFWQSDSTPILGVAQSWWGIALVVAAVALITWRYVQEKTEGGLLEACALALLGFFMLATRMHERYSFDGVLFCIACVPLARRYLWGSIALSVVLFANLIYSLQYLAAVTGQTPGVDAQNLWGLGTSFFALLAVATFFTLGYAFLGGAVSEEAPVEPVRRAVATAPEVAGGGGISWWLRAQNFFDPREGLASLRAPLDYAIMGVLGAASFVLSFVRYWYPPEKVFDEIYFARAAEEYLKNMRIYENTHPPLSKLLVTLSVLLFGGLQHGDNSYGWRSLDVVFGALVVMLLFAFAKRITRSTLFAAMAAGFLIFDGMHFVQSRIATPEGFVVLFSVAAVYAFYRFWIASQVEERPHVTVPPVAYYVAAGASLVVGLIVVALWDLIWHVIPNPGHLDVASSVIVTLYVALGVYLLVRYRLFAAMYADGAIEQTYPDGSYALVEPGLTAVFAPDGGAIENAAGKVKIQTGDLSRSRSGALEYRDGDLTISYAPEPAVNYATPDGSATYANNEIRSGDAREKGGSATLWLVLFTIALGALVSSKWYGVMGFGVSFAVLIFVWCQRFFLAKRPALWGNPRGFRLDGALATILFISATVYALAWAPDLIRQSPDPNEIHNFNDVVLRQQSMFLYHDELKATHPYSSKWWEWPLDYVPIAYYYQDHRANKNDPNGCCVEEITSMPNPFILWFGLLSVPIVGVLAWRERNKGYALIVLDYLLQWLPWMESPRITFAYHFYVDIPLICLSNAIVLQRLWQWAKSRDIQMQWMAGGAIAAVCAITVGGFAFFYPILSAQDITWNAWHARMWIDKWIVGPG